jgi:hypothetical protein
MATELSDDQIAEIRQFFSSDTAELVFGRIETGMVNDWIECQDASGREHHWRMLQAILLLKYSLRDAATMKRMTQRNQERRVSPN